MLRLKRGSPISEEGLGQPLANAIDYVMTSASAAAVVSLTRVNSLSSEFEVPRQNTSRRLLRQDSREPSGSQLNRLFLSQKEQRLAWARLQESRRQSGGLAWESHKVAQRRLLAERLNDTTPAPAPAPSTDYTILDAVVQLTVRITRPAVTPSSSVADIKLVACLSNCTHQMRETLPDCLLKHYYLQFSTDVLPCA